MDDQELLARMKDADPARSRALPAVSLPDLLEASMTTTREPATLRRWMPRLAVAAAVAAGAVGGYAVLNPDEPRPEAGHSSMTLSLTDGMSMASCMPFDMAVLRDMPVAFSGTATAVTDGKVAIAVDHWYRGGDAAEVVVDHYDASRVSIDGIEFSAGKRYLITSTNSIVNFCGYSVPWTSAMATQFDAAFSR